jgi:hypothetical protein
MNKDLLNAELLTLTNIADLLALLAETDSDIVPLKSGTLAHYVLPDSSKHSRKPFLPTTLYGNIRLATHADVIEWIKAYKTAPKLGRRGNGSQQPKNKKALRGSNAKKQRGKPAK